MNGEDLANKAGLEKNNRFIFADSYYEDMPEVSEKTNFNSFQPPKKEEIKPDNEFQNSNFGNMNGSFDDLNSGFLNSNPSVMQASSMDQVIHNDYSSSDMDKQENVFNFFAHQANTTVGDDVSFDTPNEIESIRDVVRDESREKNGFFDLLGGRKRKKDELEMVHVGEELSNVSSSLPDSNSDIKNELDTNTNFLKKDTISDSTSPSTDISIDSLTSIDSNYASIEPVTSMNPYQDPLDSSFSSNQSDFNLSNPLEDTSLSFSRKDATPVSNSYGFGSNSDVGYGTSSVSSTNSDNYFFGNPSSSIPDIEREKVDVSSYVSNNPIEKSDSKESDIDFIERLKNQDSNVSNTTMILPPDDGTSIVLDNADKDFLLKREVETPLDEIEIPERKLEYASHYQGEISHEENKFIVNGDPNVDVKENVKIPDTSKIPDFMAGTVRSGDLNIETGINRELEAELLKQRQEEEERQRLLNPEYQMYKQLTPQKKTQRMVYKAGGKSYVQDIIEKPKPRPIPPRVEKKAEEVPISEEKKADIQLDNVVKEPQSIQDIIENIVGVPGLSDFEVRLNPNENPGVRFGFLEKEEKKELAEDAPTTVYDEKKDNFDYDQNFENVEVVKSDLLEKLQEKSKETQTISILARYGEDFCAKDYVTNPAIGRAEEIKQLILILLTPEKSGILIGKPGIGKTSIVEGLAYQLQRNNVPDALKGYRIVSVKTASLLGSLPTGETRLQTLVDELKDLDKVILFIDEIHMLIGATSDSAMDFANMFKESLGRGTIKVIGATTTEEYERYVLRDKAFVRRFQKVEVEEPSREHTIKILMGTLPKIEKNTGAKLKYSEFMQTEIMSFIVDITTEYKRIYGIGSRYPDICLTLLSQAFSQAVFANRKEVNINDVRKAIENSKNIYPDVIRKELLNFDRKFKDLILEEEVGK